MILVSFSMEKITILSSYSAHFGPPNFLYTH